jgi:uncharacterized protein (UPF0264 family)
MTSLLVSVRSAEEAFVCLAGGVDLIDVKEPARGSLGRADDSMVTAVLGMCAGRTPVSAACGELRHTRHVAVIPGLRYAKWGLAEYEHGRQWQVDLEDARESLPRQVPSCDLVAAAYADWQRARSPRPADVCRHACKLGHAVFLLDTWQKDGTTLLDWITKSELKQLRDECREARVKIALAGRLGFAEIDALLSLQPDWFAVRGAACRRGERTEVIDREKLGRLVELVHSVAPPATVES